jgi:hydrogenase maturation protease
VEKIALIGIGNIMFNDDGLGVYATSYIEKNFILPSHVSVFDGGTFGFSLMPYFQEYDYILIVSTTSMGDRAGFVSHFTVQEMIDQGSVRQSPNEVELLMMLEICSFLDEDMAEVDIVSMKPDDILPVDANLTDTVKEAFPTLIEKIMMVLSKRGVAIEKNPKHTSLDAIVHAFANPTMPTHNHHA